MLNVRFLRYPLNIYLIKDVEDKALFLCFCEFLRCFLSERNALVTLAEKPQMKINSLNKKSMHDE